MKNSRRQFLQNSLLGTSAVALLTLIQPAPALFAAGRKGEAFPDLKAFGLEGEIPDLAGKVVLVDFWASWCGPCRQAMPVMAALHKEYSPRGFVVLGVSIDESREDMEAYLKRDPMPFAIVRDPKGRLARSLGVAGIPTSFILDRSGKIHSKHEGFGGESSRKKYVADIESLLGQPAS
jgi:cytochrome c biogenesis protein CcmG/thiol:disulfide interchange protein DsbE